MIKAVVVDDETPAREELIYLIKSLSSNIEIVGEGSCGLDALELCKKHSPDILFLDIQMPELTGVEVVSAMIATMDHLPEIIFVTAFEHFALRAFDLNAADYILKPIEKDRLKKAIEKVEDRLKSSVPNDKRLTKIVDDLKEDSRPIERITLYKNGCFIPINCDQIIYATVEDKITYLYTEDGKFDFSGTLTNLEELLSGGRFFRAHRGHLINLDMIESVEPWFNNSMQVRLKNIEDLIPISRGQTKEFKELMNII